MNRPSAAPYRVEVNVARAAEVAGDPNPGEPMPVAPTVKTGPETTAQATERAVASLLLGEYPGTLTRGEVIRYVSRGRAEESFDEDDRVDGAIREMVSTGLLRLEGERLHVSAPALHLHRLTEVP